SSTNSLKLVADSIVPKILSQSDFPLALYLVDSSNALTNFPNDYEPTILPSDYFHVKSKKISSGDSIDLFDAKSLKDGSTTLNIIAGSYPASVTLGSASSSPTIVDLDYPTTLLANSNNLMGIQVFDSNANPRYLDSDVSLKLISSNDSVIFPPSNVTIPKGDYYSEFNVIPNLPGSATVSVIANNLPLTTYPVKVESLSPVVTLNSPSVVLPEETFFANITAKRYDESISNLTVDWKVSGATIQSSDKTTNRDGVANISLMPNSTGKINLDAIVSSPRFGSSEVKETVEINSTNVESSQTNTTSSSSVASPGVRSFKINGIDPLPFAVVGSIAAGGILIKKKNIHLFQKNSANPNNRK
ncbi:MAG: hypothetical protein KGL95_09065, partial [Patescibacteria group bacterium]|nr:hypothetical protein [Patescibacteria group bacterium]